MLSDIPPKRRCWTGKQPVALTWPIITSMIITVSWTNTFHWEVILPKLKKDASVLIEVGSLEKYKKSVVFLENVRKERLE